MSESKTTTDHNTIRKWVEERGGKPATVKGTERGKQKAGILRIDFPEQEPDEGLEPLPWGQFFKKFDEENLAFLYQETTSSGERSRFNRFVSR